MFKILLTLFSDLLKPSTWAEFYKERRKYRSDCKLGEEVLSIISIMDDSEHMDNIHANAYLLCQERVGTFSRAAKRLRKRGFNREADMVEEFVEQIKVDAKKAANCRNCLVSVRLCLISYKGLGPIFDARIKLDGLKHDYDIIRRLSIR